MASSWDKKLFAAADWGFAGNAREAFEIWEQSSTAGF
jgi:hypothetical protein